MDLQNIYYIGELIAAFAVVASLIFLGIQMRQNTGALKATVESDMMSSWITVMSPHTTSSEFVAAQIEFSEAKGPADISTEALIRLLAFWSGGMKNAEFSYYRYLSGDMEDGLWLAIRNGALRPFSSAVMKEAIWPTIKPELSPKFVQHIEEAVNNGDHQKLTAAI